MASATENRFVNLYINGKQAGQSLNDIRSKHRQLTAEINRGKLTQAEYNQKVVELRKYQGVLDQHRAAVRGVNSSWTTVKRTLMSMGAALGLVGIFASLMAFIPKMIRGNTELAESFADVSKTTGLTGDRLSDLSRQLSTFDTKTSQQGLLDLARQAGKLGIEGVGNIVGFVKAADQIKVALGEDLGADAITTIGKLNNLFKVSDIFGYEQGLLKIGSVINELGAGSEASEGAIVDFISRLAGVAVQADISVEALAGYGATLDSLGQRTETSATAVSQAIIGMFSDTPTYAEIAGKSIEEFSEILNKDANEAFILFLDGLNGNNDGLAAMSERFEGLGIDGSRAITVLGALAGNTGQLREQQTLANKAFQEGISLTDEFNTKNQTLGANLSKIGKALKNVFINDRAIESFTRLTRVMADMVAVPVSETLEKERLTLNALVSQITAANVPQEQRLKLLRELVTDYPQFNSLIDAENVTNQELIGVLRAVNQEYINRIVLRQADEAIEEKAQKIADLTFDQQAKIAKGLKMVAEMERKYGFEVDRTRTVVEQIGLAYAKVNKIAAEKISFTTAGDAEDLRVLVGAVRGYGDAAAEVQEVLNGLSKDREDMAARLGMNIDPSGGLATPPPSPTEPDGNIEETKKTLAELRAQLQSINDELETASTKVEADAIKGRAAIVQAQIDAIDPKEKDTARAEKAIDQEKERYEKLLGLIRKEEEKLALARLEGRAKEEEEVRLHYEKLREEAEGHAVEIAKINELEKEALRQIDQKYGSDYDNERREAQQAIALALMSETDKKVQAETEYWEELIKQAQEKGLEYEALVTAQEKAITKIREEGSADRQKTSIEEFLVSSQAYLQGSSVIVGAIRDIADIQGKSAKFQADMAMFQQFINAGLALSNAAASAKGVTPVDYLAGLAMVTVAIMARIEAAKQMREQAGEVPQREFAQGTLSHSGDFIAGDQGREIVSGARVTPADISQNMMAANAFSRAMPQPNFSAINDGLTYTQGRQAQQSSVGASGASEGMGGVVAELREVKSLLAKAQDKRVYLVDKDYDDFLDRKGRNSARVGIRR